jgi:predicted DCC family thiol-disulfide oxidoreductase YuxK
MTRPRLVYDDDCGFCTWCARVGVDYADVEAVGFSDLTAADKERLPPGWRHSAHLLTDHAVCSGGEAIEQVLVRMHPVLCYLFAGLRRVPGYAWLRESLYRWGADRRAWWGKIVRRESL